MNQKMRLCHTDVLSYMAAGTLQLASAAVCKGVLSDGLINRWNRGTTCSQGMIRAQVGSTELHSRTQTLNPKPWYMILLP